MYASNAALQMWSKKNCVLTSNTGKGIWPCKKDKIMQIIEETGRLARKKNWSVNFTLIRVLKVRMDQGETKRVKTGKELGKDVV